METAILLQMNHEEQYNGPNRDLRDIKIQIDKLTGVVGDMGVSVSDMVTAFRGNDLGTEGIVAQMKTVVDEQRKLRLRLDALELETAKKQFYLLAFVGTLGVVAGGIIRSIIDLFKK
jgi:hypothetical protein